MDNIIYGVIAISVLVFVIIRLRGLFRTRQSLRTRHQDTPIFSKVVDAVKSELATMEEKGETVDVSELVYKVDNFLDGYIALMSADKWLDDGYVPKHRKGKCWFNIRDGKLVLTIKALIGYNEFTVTIDIPDIIENKQSYTSLEFKRW